LSTSEQQDLARVLARKAEGDAKAMRFLAPNPEIDDESIGFHAQQAIEKWIKAVMASAGLPEERIHDLSRLLDFGGGGDRRSAWI
jgi:HEPN domain-containing protein